MRPELGQSRMKTAGEPSHSPTSVARTGTYSAVRSSRRWDERRVELGRAGEVA